MRLTIITIILLTYLNAKNGILDIEWPKTNPQQQKISIPYPTILTKAIKETRLPVYIPALFAYDKNMVVVADKNFYTINFILEGATIMVSGDRTFQEDFSKKESLYLKLVKELNSVEFIQEEESGIRSSNFNRHGVNYTIEVECKNSKKDKRCSEDGFIKKLYNQLIIVGGKK